METNLIIIGGLTFVIHLVGTLAYAARIAGVRTGHIATALTLFNLLILVSRTSNSLQATFLAKRIETSLLASASPLLSDFRWSLAAAALATALGALLVPSAQRAFSRAVVIASGKVRSRQRLPPWSEPGWPEYFSRRRSYFHLLC